VHPGCQTTECCLSTNALWGRSKAGRIQSSRTSSPRRSDASASVPANGGTVVVDVVVASADPIRNWDVVPAVDAANVVSIDATGWTAQAELLAWAGLSNQPLPKPLQLRRSGLDDC